jgi:N-hydroxyarylamine O-acetyltransferase
MVDIEVSNWFTSTHPHSPFVSGLIVARHDDDGTRVSLSDWDGLALTEETPDARRVTPVTAPDAAGLLASRFGLDPALLGPGTTVRAVTLQKPDA